MKIPTTPANEEQIFNLYSLNIIYNKGLAAMYPDSELSKELEQTILEQEEELIQIRWQALNDRAKKVK